MIFTSSVELKHINPHRREGAVVVADTFRLYSLKIRATVFNLKATIVPTYRTAISTSEGDFSYTVRRKSWLIENLAGFDSLAHAYDYRTGQRIVNRQFQVFRKS